MEIVLIHGQNHLESTYHLGQLLLNEMGTNHEVKEYFLPKDMSAHCHGCCKCLLLAEEECPNYEQTKAIKKTILEADLLIFTSPVYCMHVSSGMKALLEHCFLWFMIHRPQPQHFYKQAVILTAGAGGGMKKVVTDIKDSLAGWGISTIYAYGFRSGASKWSDVSEKKRIVVQQRMKAIADKILKRNRGNVSLYTKGYFMMMRAMHKKNWSAPQDKEYWQNHGWLEKNKPWK